MTPGLSIGAVYIGGPWASLGRSPMIDRWVSWCGSFRLFSPSWHHKFPHHPCSPPASESPDSMGHIDCGHWRMMLDPGLGTRRAHSCWDAVVSRYLSTERLKMIHLCIGAQNVHVYKMKTCAFTHAVILRSMVDRNKSVAYKEAYSPLTQEVWRERSNLVLQPQSSQRGPWKWMAPHCAQSAPHSSRELKGTLVLIHPCSSQTA